MQLVIVDLVLVLLKDFSKSQAVMYTGKVVTKSDNILPRALQVLQTTLLSCLTRIS